MGIVEQYILQFNKEKQRLRRTTAVLTVLSLLVVITVSWNLRMTGITLANDAYCGIAEHQYTADCPVERILICGYPEETAPEKSWEPEAAEPTESTPETIAQEPVEERNGNHV